MSNVIDELNKLYELAISSKQLSVAFDIQKYLLKNHSQLDKTITSIMSLDTEDLKKLLHIIESCMHHNHDV